MVYYIDTFATLNDRKRTTVIVNIMACEYAFKVTKMFSTSRSISSTMMVWYPHSNILLNDAMERKAFLKRILRDVANVDEFIDTVIGTRLQEYWSQVVNKSARSIQKIWRGWRARRIFAKKRMMMHQELMLMPPGAGHESFPGGSIFRYLKSKYD